MITLPIQFEKKINSKLNQSDKENRSPKEIELEELLNGLKGKFSSFPKNDSIHTSILTIAPDCWSIRKIAFEFDALKRMVVKVKNLKKK